MDSLLVGGVSNTWLLTRREGHWSYDYYLPWWVQMENGFWCRSGNDRNKKKKSITHGFETTCSNFIYTVLIFLLLFHSKEMWKIQMYALFKESIYIYVYIWDFMCLLLYYIILICVFVKCKLNGSYWF